MAKYVKEIKHQVPPPPSNTQTRTKRLKGNSLSEQRSTQWHYPYRPDVERSTVAPIWVKVVEVSRL